jgi:hypothetical protein
MIAYMRSVANTGQGAGGPLQPVSAAARPAWCATIVRDGASTCRNFAPFSGDPGACTEYAPVATSFRAGSSQVRGVGAVDTCSLCVKPSAQPALVRTQHPPHPRETTPGQHTRDQGPYSFTPGCSWLLPPLPGVTCLRSTLGRPQPSGIPDQHGATLVKPAVTLFADLVCRESVVDLVVHGGSSPVREGHAGANFGSQRI